MRVIDPAWIGMKLRKLLDYAEPLGDFMAFVPGSAQAPPADLAVTVAYIARLIIHRYAMLGMLDERASRCARWACWACRSARTTRMVSSATCLIRCRVCTLLTSSP
jgi:ribonucleoside-diphosphate reductase alpha chain